MAAPHIRLAPPGHQLRFLEIAFQRSLKASAACLLLSLVFASLGTSGAQAQRIQDIQNPSPAFLGRIQRASVGVLAVTQGYDPFLPWKKTRLKRRWGAAMVMPNNMLLTTALLVRHATLLQIYPKGHGKPYTAQVVRVEPQMNLALLQVNDHTFWKQVKPLPLQVSFTHPRFLVARWLPDGRFEQAPGQANGWSSAQVGLGQIELPVLRGRSPLTHLGSGEILIGPKGVVAIAMKENNNQLHALSAHTLRLFFQNASQPASSQYPIAQRGFAWQPLRHNALQRWFKVESDQGVLIRKVHVTGAGVGVLQPGDILRKLDGYAIDAEGNVQHKVYGQVPFTLLLNNRLGDYLPAEILRDGASQRVRMARTRFAADAIRVHPAKWGGIPDYTLFGGLVIQELSFDIFAAWGKNWRAKAPSRLVVEALQYPLRKSSSTSERIVFISQVLADPVNVGYESAQGAIIDRLGDTPINNLSQLKTLLRTQTNAKSAQKHIVLHLDPAHGRSQIVFDASSMKEANARIAKRYRAPLR